MIGRILLPERCANVCFNGAMRNRLPVTESQSVYALYVEAQGKLGIGRHASCRGLDGHLH